MDFLREFFWSAAARAVGAVRGAHRRPPRPPRRDRGAARRLARRLPRREGLLAARDDRVGLVLAPAHARVAGVPSALRVDPAARPDAPATARRPRAARLRPPRSAARWIAVAAVLTVLVPGVAIALSSPLPQTPAEDRRAGLREREHPHPGRRGRRTRRRAGRNGAAARPGPAAARGARTSSIASTGTTARATTRSASSRATSPGTACWTASRSRRRGTCAFVDPNGSPTATYRVGVGTNWVDDPEAGDVFAFSLPVAVRG